MNFGKSFAFRTSRSEEAKQNSCNTDSLEKEGTDLASYTFGVAEPTLTLHPLKQISEKLSVVEQHFVSLTTKANQ